MARPAARGRTRAGWASCHSSRPDRIRGRSAGAPRGRRARGTAGSPRRSPAARRVGCDRDACSRPWASIRDDTLRLCRPRGRQSHYETWSATCDTLHAHTQVLGKLAVVLAPPEPQLQHAALRLTARGYETLPLPAPDGSGALVAGAGPARARGVSRSTRTGARRGSRSRPTARRPRSQPSCSTRYAAWEASSRSTRRRRRSRGACRSTRIASTRPMTCGQRRGLLRRRDPGGPRARSAPRALPRALDARERVVGIVRPRGQPVLGRAGRAAVRRLHHA